MNRYEAFDKLNVHQALKKIEELEERRYVIVATTQDPLGYYTVFARNPYPATFERRAFVEEHVPFDAAVEYSKARA
jgi:hypothetical protein